LGLAVHTDRGRGAGSVGAFAVRAAESGATSAGIRDLRWLIQANGFLRAVETVSRLADRPHQETINDGNYGRGVSPPVGGHVISALGVEFEHRIRVGGADPSNCSGVNRNHSGGGPSQRRQESSAA